MTPPGGRRRRARGLAAAAAAAAVAAAVGGCGSGSGGGAVTTTTGAGPVFGTASIRLQGPTAASEWCALLADTPSAQARGLMERTDLGGHVGMLFRFPTDTTSAFVMRNTPMPLSIAWFDAGGRLVSSTDMEPCLGDRDCPRYSAAAPYRYALEVPQGSLPRVGVSTDAVLSVGGSCRPG